MSLLIFFIFCNFATLVLSLLTAIHTRHLLQLPAIRWLLILATGLFLNSFAAINIYLSESFESKVFFFYIRIVATLFSIPVWLYFISSTFEYWSWLRKKSVTILIFLPCLVNFLMVLWPDTRPLLFAELQPFVYQGLSVVQYKNGTWYFIFYAWSAIWMLATYILSGLIFYKEKGYRRHQVAILHIGLAFSLVGSFVFHLAKETHEIGWIMFSSVSYLLTQIGIMYAILKYRLFNIVPLATVRIFRKLPDPVLVLDDRNRLMAANDKAIVFFNLQKKYVGQAIEKFLSEQLLLNSGEITLTSPDGTARHFHLVIENIGQDADGSFGRVIFFRDIAQQKHAEHRLGEGLEFRSRLLALLAHDLTSFLENQSLLSADLKARALENKIDVEKIELLTNSAFASQQLVYNIMTWAKSNAYQFQIEKRPFEWGMLINDTIEQLQVQSTLKKVEIVFDSQNTPLISSGDSEMLGSALRNILSNAVRATDSGRKIYININKMPAQVQVQIKDEGSGIPEIELHEILESSKEFLLTGLSKKNGAGIGLMITRHFIHLHSGQFEMRSKLGLGTEVILSTPL